MGKHMTTETYITRSQGKFYLHLGYEPAPKGGKTDHDTGSIDLNTAPGAVIAEWPCGALGG